jgi:catechol 2,3-dioxygenase-like lactoylglutathione lyase family enzyme
MELRLELLLVPVSNVDRAKEFYVEKAGFNLDIDSEPGGRRRVVQMTPPGSSCSITIGTGITEAAPGTLWGMHLVTPDIKATRDELMGRGVEVSDYFHYEAGQRLPGLDPGRAKYSSFASFADPDGNTWLLQEA